MTLILWTMPFSKRLVSEIGTNDVRHTAWLTLHSCFNLNDVDPIDLFFLSFDRK